MFKITYDKPNGYNEGDTITLTVVADPNDRLQTNLLTILSAGLTSPSTFTVKAGMTVDDPSGAKWTVVSDDGITAVFTTKAVFRTTP